MIEETNEISVREILIYSIAITFLLLLFGSCSRYTPTKAVEQMNKANNAYPGTVAELTRKWYPCITRSSDTVVLTKDSVIYIECPDVINGTAEDYAGTDTIKNGTYLDGPHFKVDTILPKRKTVRVPVNVPVRYVTITKKIEDSAKIKAMQAALDFENEKYSKLAERYAEKAKECFDEKEKRQRNGWQRNWLLFFIIIYFTLRVLKGISKNATPAGFIGRAAKWVLKFII